LTTNAILQSDLQSYKAKLNERQTMLLQYKENLFCFRFFFLIILFLYNREKQSSSSNHRERESLQTNVRHLVYENKTNV